MVGQVVPNDEFLRDLGNDNNIIGDDELNIFDIPDAQRNDEDNAKHNLTMACIADLINLIELHCPGERLIKNSVYKFKNFLNLNSDNNKRHFYCPSCARSLVNANDVCLNCPQSKIAHFLELPVIRQLQEIYKRQDFFNSLQERMQRPVREDIISDI